MVQSFGKLPTCENDYAIQISIMAKAANLWKIFWTF